MGTLWVFGDSFASDKQEGRQQNLELQWHRLLAKALGMEMKNFGRDGTGFDYTYQQWYDNQDSIREGDFVAIAATDLTRRWLIESDPSWTIHDTAYVSREQLKAAMYYYKLLDHDGASEAKLYNWLCALEKKARDSRVRILFLPAFKYTEALVSGWRDRFQDVYIANGYLSKVKNREYVDQKWGSMITRDGRCNHMSPPNHEVLVSKILDWINHGKDIDLDQGFHTGIIGPHNFNDPTLFAVTHMFKPE